LYILLPETIAKYYRTEGDGRTVLRFIEGGKRKGKMESYLSATAVRPLCKRRIERTNQYVEGKGCQIPGGKKGGPSSNAFERY